MKELPAPQSTSSVYVTTGRGGAGNYISPTELTKGNATPSSTASYTKPTHASPNITVSSSLPSYRGRGGAGNFQAYTASQRAQSQTENQDLEKKEEELQKSVAQDVESGLQKPPGAWIEVPEGRERE